MRSRTELVTNQLEGSEFEDESDFEDSEEDWQPAKGEQKPKKIKGLGRARKAITGKNGAKRRSRKPAKKSKKKAGSGEDGDCSDDEFSQNAQAPSPPKKSKKEPLETTVTEIVPEPVPVSVVKAEPTTSATLTSKPQPLQRKIVTPVKSFPDKGGFLNLFVFKGDLKDGIINNPQLCLWRRDGSSLLQKYLRDKTVDADIPQYNSSMVYSCWEDKRADEYLEIKVKCLEQSKQIRVELTDAAELEAKSRTEYDNYVAVYGIPPVRTSTTKDDSNEGAADDDDDDDDDYEEEEVEDGEEAEESEDAAQEE